MSHWHQLLLHIVETPCGRRLSTLQDVAEYAARNAENRRWKYAAECARLAALQRDIDTLREATVAAENAAFLDGLIDSRGRRGRPGKTAA